MPRIPAAQCSPYPRRHDDVPVDTDAETDQPLDKRRRELHPERIAVGDMVFERNDVVAKRFGETERTFNKRDRKGAPFAYFGGVKYRPTEAFGAFVLSDIRSQRPLVEPKRRRRSR